MAFRDSAIQQQAVGGVSMERRSFNLLIGAMLAFGFAALTFTSWIVLQPAVRGIIASHELVFGIVSIVLSLVSMGLIILGGNKQSTTIMTIGYVLFTFSFGALTSIWLPRYNIDTVCDAFLATMAICAIFGVLGLLFPRFFERAVTVAVVALIGVIIASLLMRIIGIAPTWIDYVTVALFAIFIGYDVHMASTVDPNMFNAILVATNIFVDIINIFLTLLDIMNDNYDRTTDRHRP